MFWSFIVKSIKLVHTGQCIPEVKLNPGVFINTLGVAINTHFVVFEIIYHDITVIKQHYMIK